MSSAPREPRTDEDGVRITRHGGATSPARLLGVGLVIAAFAVVVGSAAAVWWLRRESPRIATPAVEEPEPRIVAPAAPADAAARVVAAGGEPRLPRAVRRSGDAAPTPAPRTEPARREAAAARQAPSGVPADAPNAAPADAAARAEEREKQEIGRIANEVVAGMRAAGETTGLAAIPPPGTNPVKPGLVVPKDFPLPEGYVRHYQMTDDGKRLEPILMFSPDYTFVDEAGNPIEIPKDGIVPPAMAPPGLPLRTLDVPGAPRPKTADRAE